MGIFGCRSIQSTGAQLAQPVVAAQAEVDADDPQRGAVAPKVGGHCAARLQRGQVDVVQPTSSIQGRTRMALPCQPRLTAD